MFAGEPAENLDWGAVRKNGRPDSESVSGKQAALDRGKLKENDRQGGIRIFVLRPLRDVRVMGGVAGSRRVASRASWLK